MDRAIGPYESIAERLLPAAGAALLAATTGASAPGVHPAPGPLEEADEHRGAFRVTGSYVVATLRRAATTGGTA